MTDDRDSGERIDDITIAVMSAVLKLYEQSSNAIGEEGMQIIKRKLLRDSRVFVGDVCRSTTHIALAHIKREDARRMRKLGER